MPYLWAGSERRIMEEVIKVEEIPKQDAMVKSSPDSLLERAIDGKLDITIIRELVLLKKQWDDEQARKAYTVAMGDFQRDCPIIIKSIDGGVTKTGQVAYKFAPMDVILATKNKDGVTVKDLIARCGFSYTFDTPITSEKGVDAKMTIRHREGHAETLTTFMPFVEKTGVMSPPQVVGSTRSYAMRYAFMNGFGITTGGEDNDGQGRELLESQFNDLVKDWRSNAEIIAVANTIESNGTYRDFLGKLPKLSDVDRFTKCLEKVDRIKRQPLWVKFEKACIAMKWLPFLEMLEKQVGTIKPDSQENVTGNAGDQINSNPIESTTKEN